MFAEEAFADDDGFETTEKRTNESHSERAELPQSVFVQFHRPGDPLFSIVCGANVTEDNELYSNKLINGDSWGTNECRCIQCECLRVTAKLEEWTAARGGVSPILVLLDLDNFGFNQFKSVPPRLQHAILEDPLPHVFVWSFFGSCFTRYHKKWPSEATVSERFSSADSTAGNKSSVWQSLVGSHSVHFTPCSGARQGADCVMVNVVKVFYEKYKLILVTGDVELMRFVKTNQRKVGKKSVRRESLAVDLDDERRIGFIDVNESGKRFVPVWRSLIDRVTRMRKEVEVDSDGDYYVV